MAYFKSPLSEFANDLYDVLAMNGHFCTQEQFYYKHVENDDAFMLDEETDKAYIYFDDFKITIENNH